MNSSTYFFPSVMHVSTCIEILNRINIRARGDVIIFFLHPLTQMQKSCTIPSDKFYFAITFFILTDFFLSSSAVLMFYV